MPLAVAQFLTQGRTGAMSPAVIVGIMVMMIAVVAFVCFAVRSQRRVFAEPAASRLVLWGGGVFIPRRRAPPPKLFSRPRLPPAWTGYLLSECAGPITAYLEIPGSPELMPLAADPGAQVACRESAGS